MGVEGVKRRGPIVVILLVVVGLATVAGATAMEDRPSGEAVLNETREQYVKADTVVGSAVITVTNDSATATASVEFAIAENRSRVVVTRNNDTYRAGTNGDVAWYSTPDETGVWELEALDERASRVGAEHNLTRAKRALETMRAEVENSSVEVARSDSEDGTPADVVQVTPGADRSDGQTTLWIAKADASVLRAEFSDGSNQTIVDFQDTQFNVSVHESTFDPPAERLTHTSVERYDTFAGTQANTTIDLPEVDADFREAGIRDGTDGIDVVQRYRARGDNVTVVSTTVDRTFERSATETANVTVNGQAATVTSVGGRTVVYWRSEGVTTAVMVNAGEERAVELARQTDT